MTIETLKQARDAVHVLERQVQSLRAQGDRHSSPGDPYGGLIFHEEADSLEEVITALRQAISQPNCRGCLDYLSEDDFGPEQCACVHSCINGNKYQALPVIRLYKATP